MKGQRSPGIPADIHHIDLDDPRELRYWLAMLGCSEARLRDAVAQVGRRTADVRERLRQSPGDADSAPRGD